MIKKNIWIILTVALILAAGTAVKLGYIKFPEPEAPITDYLKENSQVFYKGKIIEKADFASFIALDYLYAKDKERVYYKGQILDQADSASFVKLGIHYTKDKNHVFSNGKILKATDPTKEVDPASFVELKPVNGLYGVANFEGDNFVYAKDKNRVYFYSDRGTIAVKEADPDSFIFLEIDLAKDKNHTYHAGVMESESKPETKPKLHQDIFN